LCNRVCSAVLIQSFDDIISVIVLHSSVLTSYPIIKIPISSRGRVVLIENIENCKWRNSVMHTTVTVLK